MATIDLGKIKQVWRGTYNNGTAYTVDDLVAYTDTVGGLQNTSTYICVTNSTGNAPASAGTVHGSWNLVAQGVPDRLPSQSGQAGKFLTTNGSAVSFGTVTQVIKKIHSFKYSTRTAGANVANNNQFTWTSAFTPLDTANSFWINGWIPTNSASQDFVSFGLRFERSGGSTTDFPGWGPLYTDQPNYGMFGYGFTYDGTFDGAGTYTIFHRTFSTGSHADYYNLNSSDDSRVNYSTDGFLQIIEYGNA